MHLAFFISIHLAVFACVCLFECVRLWRNKEREQQLTATAVYQAAGIVLFAEAHNK